MEERSEKEEVKGMGKDLARFVAEKVEEHKLLVEEMKVSKEEDYSTRQELDSALNLFHK